MFTPHTPPRNVRFVPYGQMEKYSEAFAQAMKKAVLAANKDQRDCGTSKSKEDSPAVNSKDKKANPSLGQTTFRGPGDLYSRAPTTFSSNPRLLLGAKRHYSKDASPDKGSEPKGASEAQQFDPTSEWSGDDIAAMEAEAYRLVYKMRAPTEAVAVYEKTLLLKEKQYGPDHPEVAKTLANLGNAYGLLGDAAKQRDMLERALKIKEAHYGPDHPEVAITLANLGNAYGALGDAAKKRVMLERSLRIFESYDHPAAATVRAWL